MQTNNAISFLLGALAIGIMQIFPPAGKPTEGTEVLRSGIAPSECTRQGGRIEYEDTLTYSGAIRGCWLWEPRP